jgi:hypothetical protein
MPKLDLPEPTGKCPYCTINLYPPNNKPATMPCGVNRKVGEQGLDEKEKVKVAFICPFETEKDQKKLEEVIPIAGVLGTMFGQDLYE